MFALKGAGVHDKHVFLVPVVKTDKSSMTTSPPREQFENHYYGPGTCPPRNQRV